MTEGKLCQKCITNKFRMECKKCINYNIKLGFLKEKAESDFQEFCADFPEIEGYLNGKKLNQK
jgi:hypothetical protein